MGFLSQAGHLGIKTQLAKGAFSSPSTGAAVNEVVTLTNASASGGTFTLTYGGQTTAAIAYNATAANIELAFEALTTVGVGNGTCAGGPLNTTPVTITFTGALAGGNAGAVTIGTGSLTGGTINSAVTTPGVSTGGIFLYTKSGSLGGNRELLIPDAEIGGNRDIPDAQLGPIAYSGEFEFYCRMDALPTLLNAALGSVVTTGNGTSTPFTHTVTPTDTSLPWLSVEERIADGYMTFKYTDCKINTLHLEAEANGYLMGTIGLIGLTQETTTETVVGNRDYDTTPMIVGSNVCVRWGGVDLPAKSFSFDINNNIEDDDFRLCSMTLGDLVEKRREVTMSATIRPQDSNLWKTAMWGSPTATAPLGQSYKDDVEIEFESYEDIPATSPPAKYNTLIPIPQAIIAPFNVEPSGDDVIEHDIEIRPVRPTPATPILTAVVKNGMSKVV